MSTRLTAQRVLIVGCLVIVLVGADAAIARAQQPPPDVATLLPADGGTVDVMQPASPRRFEELAAKLQAALAKDPEWTKSFISTAKPGEPPPYDEKLGLTKVEYDELLALAKQGGLTKVASGTVRVTRDGTRFVLQFDERFKGMERIEVDLEKDSAVTPAGVVSGRQPIVANAQQSATGPWDGVQWRSRDSAEDRSKATVSLAVGRLQATGRGILHYRVSPGASDPTGVQYVLFYDLPKAR